MEQLDKRLNLLKNEVEIFNYWKKEKIYSLIREKEKDKEVWRFIDGPPYTTGSIHPGTAWNKILKDYLIKYKRMRGYKVTDTPGYDTHGLPIEVQMEKELGIDNKQEIYDYGVDKFIKNCKEFAEKNVKLMNDQFKRLGCYFWDWKNPYITFKNSYIEGIWWTLKQAWENDMLYQFYRPLNCCPRCATALAKHEHEYEEITDTSLFLKIKSTEMEKTYFIIWTTTPWTLVANTAIMANPTAEYVKVHIEDLDEYWILSKQSVTFFISGQLGHKYKIVETFYGEELEGKKYEHPLIDEVPYQKELAKESKKVHSIILSEEYVSVSEAVGLVHTAPGHGPEDFEVGVEYNLPIFNPVDIRGDYREEAGKFAGKNIFEANQEILELLEEKGTLILTGEIEHEYAHCWRCGSKLVYRATKQWFFKTEDLSPKLLEKNEEIQWIPDWAGSRWFKSWLSTLKDWCISRQRFWGIPLSVWICDNEECKDTIVIGSAAELKEKAGEIPEDLHRPWIDKVEWKCEKCKDGTKKRIKDILDVWLDSGSVMWASQEVYDGEKHFDTWKPADFILEGKDQIRGWFNSLLCSAMISSNRKNYDTCYMHGFMLRDNEKMSKSKGNYFELEDLIQGDIKGIKNNKKYSHIKGIGTFRFYSIGATQPGRDLNFNLKEYTDTFKIINTIWNVYYFASQKFNLAGFDPSEHRIDEQKFNEIDKWLLSKINSTIKKVTELSDDYNLPFIPGTLRDFILNDVSRWYIMLNREKIDVYSEDPDKFNIMALLYETLYKFLLMLAPVNPMLTEKLYLELYQPFLESMSKQKTKSIHLQEWPKLEEKYIDEDLESQMEFVRELIEVIRSIKNEQRIRLRWPNKRLIIVPKETMPELKLDHLVKDMTNIKEIQVKDSVQESDKLVKAESRYGDLYLDVSVDDAIIAERVENDLLRNIQYTRKKNDLKVGEPIDLIIGTKKESLRKELENDKEEIASKVSADEIEIELDKLEEKPEFIYNEINLCPNEKCHASLKVNIMKKVEDNRDVNCPYCGETLKHEDIIDVSFQFKRL
ncbi:MAG: Isoleucine--tRNA ligase [Promethearchaeota archaeon]|nr:MAG: Isoleucine--tRNA ligase [Candidatus Lokiarchaeota archaeon]